LFDAVIECFEFFEDDKDLISRFYSYLCNSVKLIVNSVEPHIESETVFKNLNSNKVPLTETELVKGLLITHTGRGRVEYPDNSFREVLEVRLSLGKSWEEIQQWCQIPAIKSFFFENNQDSLNELLRLTAMKLDTASLKKHRAGVYPLFDFYNQYPDLNIVFQELINTYKRLADWYSTDEIYHLIGFCRHAKNNTRNNLKFLLICLEMPTKKALMDWLSVERDVLIYRDSKTSEAIKGLHYGEDNDQIHAVLLALSVFPKTSSRNRFDFEMFKQHDWSLEHIFPQTPEGKGHVLTDAQKHNIRDMLVDVSEEVEDVLSLDNRIPEERHIYENALKEIGALDTIGNMCLLSKSDNSALGNHFFEGKRNKVLSLLQQGSFVPRHTFDVFSRMIDGLDGNIDQWSAKDIQVHAEHIGNNFDYDGSEVEQ